MFIPPRCPNAECPRHLEPRPGFFVRRGYYYPLCRAHAVPRFRCRTCGKGFSRQTFCSDYRDRRPDLNPLVFVLLASGLGQRQTARIAHTSLKCVQRKFRRIATHLRDLNRNLRGPLPAGSRFQLDELETYEGRRNTRPLTLPVLIEAETRFIVWAESAPIRPRGKMTDARRRAIAVDEQRFGPRVDESARALRNTLDHGARLVADHATVAIDTDEKSVYPKLVAEAFGAGRLQHSQTNSRLARGTWNRLFPINHTEAMVRDLVGRMRRESWLVSKRGDCLDLHMQLHMSYRNYMRRRFNHDAKSPAWLLGFTDRKMTPGHLLSWRQDWAEHSIHPLARRWESVGQWMAARNP